MGNFSLFIEQKNRLMEALKMADHKVWFPVLRGNYQNENPGNWFICFIPSEWGYWKNNYGIHFSFAYGRARKELPERFKLNIGVEKPMQEEYRQSFKEDIIVRANALGISRRDYLLQARPRTKLLEVDPIPFNQNGWQIAMQRYEALQPIVEIIGTTIREYYEKGAFEGSVQFLSESPSPVWQQREKVLAAGVGVPR